MNKFILVIILAMLCNTGFTQVFPETLSAKGTIKEFNLEEGYIELATGKYILSDKLKVYIHTNQLYGNEVLENGQFIEFWLIDQKDIPTYRSSTDKIITVIKILSEIDIRDKQH
jgi:hypothetical protein